MNHADVCQQDDIHHQGIDNGGNSHNVVIKHKGTTGNGDGLSSILHTDLNHYGTLFLTRQTHQPRQHDARQHGQQYQYRDGHAQLRELLNDGLPVLNKEYRGQKNQQGKGQTLQHIVHLLGRIGTIRRNTQTDNDGNGHQYDVLHQKIAHRQMYIDGTAHIRCHRIHNQRPRKQCDDTAESRQRHRQRHITARQHREHVAGTTARTTGNQHDAQEEYGLHAKQVTYLQGNQGQTDNLSCQTGNHGIRAFNNQSEVRRTQR